MISVVLTIHNQADLLPYVLGGIDLASELLTEYIVVFDGCTDSSEECVSNWYIPGMWKYNFKYIWADNVFETKANNLGLREVTQPYAVIVQDDCVIGEPDWDKRLLAPFLYLDNVVAVSGNQAHDVILSDTSTVSYPNLASRKNIDRDTFAIRDVVNRGPLMLDMVKLRTLNYFDEQFSPQSCDDHDLCLRAYTKYQWVSGVYWIDFESQLHWGSSRKGDNSWWYRAFAKNTKLIRERHFDYLEGKKHSKDIKLCQTNLF